jgi:poly(A) polymerase
MSGPDRIAAQPWMTAPPTRAVMAALTGAGGAARFVGGCVRDAALGRAAKDIDIATPLVPEEVARRIEAAGLKAVPTGLKHGTITAVAAGRPYEITTLRRDVETFGRHATVAFTTDWREDAARRDFTFNAMFAEPDGALFDYFGGRADLAAGRVRFVGNAETRILEDVLRLLRFYRFHGHYGRGAPDPAARAACRAHAGKLPTLSAERVREELLRILDAPAPAAVLTLMDEDGVLATALPEAGERRRLDRLAEAEAALGDAAGGVDPVRRLAAVLGAGADVGALARRLRLSNRDRARLAALAAPEPAGILLGDVRAWRRLLYRHGAGTIADRALIEAATTAAPDRAALGRLLAVARAYDRPRLPVDGRDAAALGVPEGAAIGRLLAAVETWWIDGDFRANREGALAELARRAGDERA